MCACALEKLRKSRPTKDIDWVELKFPVRGARVKVLIGVNRSNAKKRDLFVRV